MLAPNNNRRNSSNDSKSERSNVACLRMYCGAAYAHMLININISIEM